MSATEGDGWPGQLIHQAALYNNEDLLHCLLQGEESANVDCQDVCGRTAVYTAVSNDSLQCLHILLNYGADMNIPAGPRCHNMTPLHEAVMNRRMDTLALLVSQGADLSLKDESGQTPLALARMLNHQDAIEVIMMEQEKKRSILEQFSVELCGACAEGNVEKVERVLEKTGAFKKRVINMDTRGLSPLGIAAKCGHVDILNLLLKEGATCTSQKDTGLTLLHLACESGHNEIITILLQTFPELIFVRSVDHQTPLHSAVANNRISTVELILSFDYPKSNSSSQIHAGVEETAPKAKCFVDEGSAPDVNARDAAGDTPLHIACRNGYLEIAKLLLDFKVKVRVLIDGDTPVSGSDTRNLPPEVVGFDGEADIHYSEANLEDEETNLNGLQDSITDLIGSLNSARSQTLDDNVDAGIESDNSPLCPFPELPSRTRKTRKTYRFFHPVKVNLLNSNGLSSFHTTIRYKQPSILSLILEARSPLPNKILVKNTEESVLMFAYAFRHIKVLKLLLSYGHQDVDNQLLSSAFFSQDHEVQWLLLTYKSLRDTNHSLNKAEMRRLASQLSQIQPAQQLEQQQQQAQALVVQNGNTSSPSSISVSNRDTLLKPRLSPSFVTPTKSDGAGSFRSRVSTMHDPDAKRKYPSAAVAVVWEGVGMLNTLEASCLESASRLHNPLVGPTIHTTVCLCAITKVDISKNSFEQLPSILLGLPSLVILKASRNLISSIPEDMAALVNCPALEELHLNENRLTQLPRFLFQLPMLKYLDLSVNRLNEIPVEVWEAPALVTLRLASNSLTYLPNCCGGGGGGHLSRRQHHHQITNSSRQRRRSSSSSSFQQRVFSSSVGSMSAGEATVDVNGGCENPLYAFGASGVEGKVEEPVEFTMLSPQEVTTNPVVRVNKWSSGIAVVDRDPWKGAGQLKCGLKQLWLTRNRFTQIPPCLACCAPNLEILVMSENPLTSVGLISDYPALLIELDLSRAGLATTDQWKFSPDNSQDTVCYGPLSSFQGPKLSAVSLDSCGSPVLNSRKRSSSASGAAQEAGMGFCSSNSSSPSLREMMPVPPTCHHRGHTTLSRLEKLYLGFNRLTGITLTRDPPKDNRALDTNSICSMESEEIQSRLLFPNLSELDLGCNKLTSLSPDIGELSNLKVLSLRGNAKLRELPPKLGLLKSLWKLELELCPLDGAIHDFLQNSRYPVKDILGFLQSVLEESTEYICMNLMFVGFHSIGKTSLLQRLCEKGRMLQKYTHWRDRVNNEETKRQTTLLSTVGIDINELMLEKKGKPVMFRTWDFGGQKEYYATHQYFLSPRSLYLVVWSIIDGERGVESLLQWLINIQARAPGAPVIIVGTHLDILRDRATRRNFPEDFEESMMMLIQKMFLSNPEPDKSGLPNILAAVNVSCKTGENIRTLVDMIYDNAFDLKHPRSRTQYLIGQKIPRKYLLLQRIIRELARERIKADKEPVLVKTKYTLCVQNKMMEHGVTFRDIEELEQATRFLHENGVLFHYDDLPLRDLYFLDPQWLCDQLAKVITVKEINNFAQRGVMRLKNLEFLFKSSGQFRSEHIRSYITSLLNKFEVALQFDEEHLLLPSLLPTETELLEMARKKSDVRIPLRKSTEASVGLPSESQVPGIMTMRSIQSGRRLTGKVPKVLHVGSSVFYTGVQNVQDPPTINSLKDSPRLLLLAVKPTSNPIFSLCRLYFMTYFPSGFWSRLITRVLADGSFYDIVRDLFDLPADLMHRSPEVRILSEKDPEWRCWQTGFELFYMGFEVMRIREVSFSTSSYFCDYSQCRIKCSIDNEWSFLDVLNSKILEITFPTDSLRFYVANKDGPQLQNLDESKPSNIVYREEVATTKLLVKIVEHVDILLQDWYPDLGEQRFSQNCEGRYLVTRVVPCQQCLHQEVGRQKLSERETNPWFFLNPEVPDMCMPVVVPQQQQLPSLDSDDDDVSERGRERSQTCRAVMDKKSRQTESKLPAPGQRPRTLTEGQAMIYHRDGPDSEPVIFTWLVERCMLDVLEGVDSVCPVHGSVSPLYLLGMKEGPTGQQFVAPDVAFQDQFQDLLLPASSHLDIGQCLGKGNFGEVHHGIILRKELHQTQHVAVKILFKQSHARSEAKRGFRTSLELGCTAYLTARQEVSILTQLEHEHIVPLVGLCLHPLALLLDLAPKGALNSWLQQLQTKGELLPLFVIKQICVQVSKALAYLHSNNIIYRDLKSENVLVWELPQSADAHPQSHVDVKLADYGISRSVLPTGARGFGGTPPFIAPEILQHAGKGTYTSKVDVYSFGMFLFEILTCRIPFANVNNPNNLICQGERPSFTVQEAERCPSYMLDLVSVCWSHSPDDRPSMEGVLGICQSPQFCHLQDVVTLGPDVQIYCGCTVPPATCSVSDLSRQYMLSPDTMSLCSNFTNMQQQQQSSAQLWLSSGFHGNNGLEVFTFNHARRVDTYKTVSLTGAPVVAICVYDSLVWCVDSDGIIHIFESDSLSLVHEIQLPLRPHFSPVKYNPANTSPSGSGGQSTILGMYACPCHQCVLVTCSESRLYLVHQPLGGLMVGEERVEVIRLDQAMDEVGQTVGEMDGETSDCKPIKSYCSVMVNTENSCEVWLGQNLGHISVWDLSRGRTSYLNHGGKVTSSSASCAFLVTQTEASTSLCRFVWSYTYPGSMIYQWDAITRTISRRLDCSQIVSTVDSPVLAMPNSLDHRLHVGESQGGQVSCLSAIQKYLYVGTTRGSLLVTEAATLTPLCVFQCHAARDFYIRLVLPVTPVTEEIKALLGVSGDDSSCAGSICEEQGVAEEEAEIVESGRGKLRMPAVVSVGKGYSNTLKRFHPTLDSPEGRVKDDEAKTQPDPFANHTFMLAWNAADWDLY